MEIVGVSATALRLVRDDIITGTLTPGQRLNESDLSQLLGISRPPLREALRLLETDRLVVNIPRKGTYVSQLSLPDLVEVGQVREMMECSAIDLLEEAGNRDVGALLSALDESRTMPVPDPGADARDLLLYIRAHLAFHFALVESARSELLTQLYYSISHQLARYQFIYFTAHEAPERSLHDHTEIAQLLQEAQSELAKKCLRDHIRYGVSTVANKIDGSAQCEEAAAVSAAQRGRSSP
jgi:DNA-binding GntR family transcriptional regulator